MSNQDQLRVKQVARELGMPFTRVTRLVRRGTLKARRPGPPGTWLIQRAELDAYIADRDREAAERARLRQERTKRDSFVPVCKHTGTAGFCGKCDGQWVVQATDVTYVFDLDVGSVTIIPGDVDGDGIGPAPYPQFLMLDRELGVVSVNRPMEFAAQDLWGKAQLIQGWVSFMTRV